MTQRDLADSLYEKDYYQWLTVTAEKLRQGKLAEIDVVKLIEEIEDMGRSERKAVRSNLRILLMHLLKYKYQQEKRTNSWLLPIVEHRKRLQQSFKDSPSLKSYFLEVFDESYQDAIDLAAAETGLSRNIFPHQSPFTPQETLNSDCFSKYRLLN
ncbi:MAG: DUF29 domain-containing protein [Cyanobacteria bacterium P01_F01_bin.143]